MRSMVLAARPAFSKWSAAMFLIGLGSVLIDGKRRSEKTPAVFPLAG